MEDEGRVELIQQEIDTTPLRKDVAGKAGEFVDDFIRAKDSEKIYSAMGVQPDKTFLISGPPGTGKTLATRALNNEANIKFREKLEEIVKEQALAKDVEGPSRPVTADKGDLGVLMFPYDIGKFGTAYINRGSLMVQNFFDQAGMYAKYEIPTVIVLDEADALLSSRRDNTSSHGEDNKVLETIMKNLQTVHDTPNMYAILMTNFSEKCDDASIRAGRIDKQYVFDLPTLDERIKGYELAAERLNENAGYKVVRNFDASILAEMSDAFNYADIVESVNSAVKYRAKEISLNRENKVIPAGYVSQKRLENAVKEHAGMFKAKTATKTIGF